MAFALDLHVPAHVDRPVVAAPGPREISFGDVAGRVGPGTHRVVVYVDGARADETRVAGPRFALRVRLPPRDVRVEVVAEDALGNSARTTVGPVLGLPPAGKPRATRPAEDQELAERVRELVDGFEAVSGVYVQSLATGAGAAWNARARFPAASTVKLAIAIETLRVLRGRPPPGSEEDALLEAMLVESDNEAANALLAWLGGSETGGASEVNETLDALGLDDSHLYGGFLVAAAGRPIPLRVEDEPSFAGKHTTAWDLARLHTGVHLAAGGLGPLVRLPGFTGADARFLLWHLAHAEDTGKLDRYVGRDVVVPHKAGWVTEARHDAGIVYGPHGAFVAVVMTYTGAAEAGEASDDLAGLVAKAALDRFAADDDGSAPAVPAISFSL